MEDLINNPVTIPVNKENYTPVSFIDGLAKKHKEHVNDQAKHGNMRFRPGSNVMGLSDLSPDLDPQIKAVGLYKRKPIRPIIAN